MTDLTEAFLTVLTGSPDTSVDWRIIHDTDKGQQGINLRGTLSEMLTTLQTYNAAGWGIFLNINAMKPGGHRTLENVDYIRAHVVDLDNPMTAQDSYNRACSSDMPPQLAVQTSPGKYHLYWLVEPYQGNDFYSTQQRKLAQLYSGDSSIIDPTRVLRVPGFNHCKSTPTPVTCWQVSNHPRYTHEKIASGLAAINVVQHNSSRRELGDPDLKAPSIEWLIFALDLFDPNDMDRHEWVPLSAAFKQAGWLLADEKCLLDAWLRWCAKYHQNDVAENMKLWNSIRDSEVGWGRFERLSMVKAYINNNPAHPPDMTQIQNVRQQVNVLPPPQVSQRSTDLPDILDVYGKQLWFKDCYFIIREGTIFSPTGRFMKATHFNGAYGGKEFSLKSAGGKLTDEPWKAALRATDWQIPKVDHVRFLPEKPPFSIIKDRLGRDGLNIYMPVIVDAYPGDITRFLNHVSILLPNPDDQRIFISYLAHMVKFPGYKIPWAVLLQGAEGIGKTAFFEVLQHALGEMYVYRPKAQELIASGSKFNAWMRAKLAIIVDEIKIDERRELIEILKPMITDLQIEIQAKGVDQEMEDNVANWLFFSNFKDAIPITKNGRRYCILFSAMQTEGDMIKAGLNDEYFVGLYNWLREGGGLQNVTHWLMNYPIERGSLPVKAPRTSSYAEALRIGRSPLEILIDEKVESGERGFHNGYISWPMLMKAISLSSMRTTPAEHVVRSVLSTKGYHELGYTATPVGGEDMMKPSLLFGIRPDMRIEDY